MSLLELYNFDDIFAISKKRHTLVWCLCLLVTLFLVLTILAVWFLHGYTLACVGVVFALLLLGYFVCFVLFYVKIQRLDYYRRFLTDMQSGLRVEGRCQVLSVDGVVEYGYQLGYRKLTVKQDGVERKIYVESSIDLPFGVGDKCQIQTVGDCLVAVCVYES